MVRISTSLIEAPEADGNESGTGPNDKGGASEDKKSSNPISKGIMKEVITAHIHMKSWDAAWHAYSTIAGNRLWGYPLVAAIFPSLTGDNDTQSGRHGGPSELGEKPASSLLEAREPVNSQTPYELADRFAITVPGGAHIWGHTPDGKIIKLETEDNKSKKHHRVKGSYSKRPSGTARRSGDNSTSSTLIDATAPCTQLPIHGAFANGFFGQIPSWGWVQDCYGQWVLYQRLPGVHLYAATHVPLGEAPAKHVQYPTLEDTIARNKLGY
ncbi:MAG: hypothetical protein LQ338_006638 [Usnochroma carphineum]|nr:MAG: hypothetical protein LQ338_006638 [Usnochroma carphineum]